MKILCIDCGLGTQDLLLFDSEKKIENCIQLVTPSSSSRLSSQIKNTTPKNLFLTGRIMGGSPLWGALKKIISSGKQVVMAPTAALSIRYDLDEVQESGVIISEKPPKAPYSTIETKDLDFPPLIAFLDNLEPNWRKELGVVAVAVQEHGVPPKGTSARKFRFHKFQQQVEMEQQLSRISFSGNNIPEEFPRMCAVRDSVREYFPGIRTVFMDSSYATVLGVLYEREIPQGEYFNITNIGNGHTVSMILGENSKIVATFEHHTALLSQEKIGKLILKMLEGELSNNEVFDDGGHGAFKAPEENWPKKVSRKFIIGPNRRILKGSSLLLEFPSPGGNMMMSGPLGLVIAAKELLGEVL